LIAATNELRYAERSPRNVLDLAVPRSATKPPLVVYIHGGAFRMGDKSDGPGERRVLLDSGFAVASVNYRYSTEAIWPAQLDDLRDAFAFLRSNADEFHFDGGRVASFGPSAGGHLSATCGIAFAASPQTHLTASVVWFPPVDFTAMDSDIDATGVARATGRNDLPGSPESTLIGATVADRPDLARAAGPIAQLEALAPGAFLPSFLIMHGGRDPFIAAEQSRRLYRALASFGGSPRLELDVLPDGTHGGGDFERPETMARVVAFLEDCFQPRKRANPKKKRRRAKQHGK
jgi:acetyl esterase/lipase